VINKNTQQTNNFPACNLFHFSAIYIYYSPITLGCTNKPHSLTTAAWFLPEYHFSHKSRQLRFLLCFLIIILLIVSRRWCLLFVILTQHFRFGVLLLTPLTCSFIINGCILRSDLLDWKRFFTGLL
jgi:hypothetical protein